MRNIKTDVVINASPDKVWSILTDFDTYPEWNPFIKSFEGKPAEGERFKVTIQQPGSKPMTFKPKCLKFERNKEFRWLGHLFIKGIFDGEHIFELIPAENGKTKFIQRENFNGILVPLLWNQLETKTTKGFEMMNEKLKELAENGI